MLQLSEHASLRELSTHSGLRRGCVPGSETSKKAVVVFAGRLRLEVGFGELAKSLESVWSCVWISSPTLSCGFMAHVGLEGPGGCPGHVWTGRRGYNRTR